MQCPVSRETRWLVLGLLLGLGCPRQESPADVSTPPPQSKATTAPSPARADPPGPDRGSLLAIGDARRMDPLLRQGITSSSAQTRRVSARVAARLQLSAAVPLLQSSLTDVDPGVRGWASFGLSRTPHLPRPKRVEHLAAAVAAEQNQAVLGVLVEDLGGVLSDADSPIVQRALAVPGQQQRSACGALARLARRGLKPPPDTLTQAAKLAGSAPDAATRLACAHVFVELEPGALANEVREGTSQHLMNLLADRDPELRIMALRALARFGSRSAIDWDRLMADKDYRVVVEAFRSLARLSLSHNGSTYAEQAEAELERMLEQPTSFATHRLQVLLTAFEEGGALRDAPHVEKWSETTLQRLHIDERDGKRTAEGRALAHCAAAKLADFVRKWPGKVERCGHLRVPEYLRDQLKVEVLAIKDGADDVRAALYRRLFDSGSAHVKQAVMAAIPGLPVKLATPLFLVGLADSDGAVVTAALEGMLAAAANYTRAGEKLPPGLGGAVAAAFEPISHQARGLAAWLAAVRALDQRDALRPLQSLVSYPATGIREDARRLLAEWGEAAGTEPGPIPSNTMSGRQFPDPRTEYRVELQTTAGSVVLDLDTDLTPATAQRFAGLVSTGYFDGQPIRASRAGAMVVSGDPRGLGFDGPAWTQRHEDSRRGFVRGSVGMANVGRDTAGAHFFIILRSEPGLEDSHVCFGNVSAGMGVLDGLRLGDRITHARLVTRKRGAE